LAEFCIRSHLIPIPGPISFEQHEGLVNKCDNALCKDPPRKRRQVGVT
jgi:hypothetical protein